MFGLLGFGSIGAWFAMSLWIAWRVAKLVKPIWFKVLVVVALTPLLFVAPVGDELIGKYQFKRYCKEAEEVKIYGTIPVGEEFYTADGKWKLSDISLPVKESNRLQDVLNSIVRWEIGMNIEVPAMIPIYYHETKVYEIKTGRLLSQHRIYGSRGGWLSRNLLGGPALMDAQCLPLLLRERGVNQAILPFNANVREAK